MIRFTCSALSLTLAFAPLQVRAPEHHKPEPVQPQPQILLQCIVAGIILGVGYVVIRAILKICDKCLPPPPPPPTNFPPTNNMPTNGVPYTNSFPALTLYMSQAQTNPSVVLQHQDSIGGEWVTEFTFLIKQVPGGLSTVAYDTNGMAVASNYATFFGYNGEMYGIHDFTGQLPGLQNPPPRRFYRMVVGQ